MTLVRFVGCVSLLVASEAVATTCATPAAYCYCQDPARYGVVVTESIEGPRATVRVERAGAGLTVGQKLILPRAADEAVDARWMLTDVARRPIDANGMLPCKAIEPTGYPEISEDTLMSALSDAPTCERTLQRAGVTLTGCGSPLCSTSPSTLCPILALLLLGRRRLR